MQHEVAGLILENTFTSISRMVDKLFPFLGNFKSLILRIGWDSLSRIPEIKVPIHFVCGLQDEIVPAEHVKELFEAAKNAEFKHYYEVENGMHNDTWFKGGEEYVNRFVGFLNQCKDAQKSRNTISFGKSSEKKEEVEEKEKKEGVTKRKIGEGTAKQDLD